MFTSWRYDLGVFFGEIKSNVETMIQRLVFKSSLIFKLVPESIIKLKSHPSNGHPMQ